MTRIDKLRSAKPELIVDLTLYSSECSKRKVPIGLGWGCPCSIARTNDKKMMAWDGWPLLDSEMSPGETRRVGYVFLSGEESVRHLLSGGGTFYLWEAGLIGEAKIVAIGNARPAFTLFTTSD